MEVLILLEKSNFNYIKCIHLFIHSQLKALAGRTDTFINLCGNFFVNSQLVLIFCLRQFVTSAEEIFPGEPIILHEATYADV